METVVRSSSSCSSPHKHGREKNSNSKINFLMAGRFFLDNFLKDTSCSLLDRRLAFLLSTLEIGWRSTFEISRFVHACLLHHHGKIRRLASRVETTMRGSGEEIGWLLKKSDEPPIEDGTDRFLQLLQSISGGDHMLPDNLYYLLVPGLFSNLGPLYMVNIKKHFLQRGLKCRIAQIHSEASVQRNATEIKQYIEELYQDTKMRVMIIGHSKGGVDASAAMALFWPDLKDKVAGLVLVQCPYGGSPIAADVLREGQLAGNETRLFTKIFIRKVLNGDIKAIEDLTYEKRREFLARHPLPKSLPVVTFHTEVHLNPGVFSTLHRVAHAELPSLRIPKSHHQEDEKESTGKKLPLVAPLAALCVVMAIHLALRYGERSDGLVTLKDAEVPGTVAVRLTRKLDHLWIVYSNDPTAPSMVEALTALLLERSCNRQLPSY